MNFSACIPFRNLRETVSEEFWEVPCDLMNEQNNYIITGIESDYTDWIIQ